MKRGHESGGVHGVVCVRTLIPVPSTNFFMEDSEYRYLRNFWSNPDQPQHQRPGPYPPPRPHPSPALPVEPWRFATSAVHCDRCRRKDAAARGRMVEGRLGGA